MKVLFSNVVCAVAFLAFSGCGYHVGGKADLIPKGVQTIAIPAFTSHTMQYRLADLLPNELSREFTARTRFHIVRNPAEADAVLNGTVNSVSTYPGVSDPLTGKTTSVRIIVGLSVNLLERPSGKVLYSHPNFGAGQNYELPEDPHQLIDESGPALDRLTHEVARDIVSSIVENF